MPIIQLFSPSVDVPEGLLAAVCRDVAAAISVPIEHVWAIWNTVPEGRFHRPEWAAGSVGPVALVLCKSRYEKTQIAALMCALERVLCAGLGCSPDSIYVAVQRVVPNEVLVRGSIWQGNDAAERPSSQDVRIKPIGVVRSPRVELTDDNWGGIVSTIEIDPTQYSDESLRGLEDFSHIEVVYHLHRVELERIETGARRPRGRADWPSVGIFAQRAKNRPNRIGVSRCRLLALEGLRLTVRGLDAVDGTPVLDIKPYMLEFGPIGPVHQPPWSTELMLNYYSEP